MNFCAMRKYGVDSTSPLGVVSEWKSSCILGHASSRVYRDAAGPVATELLGRLVVDGGQKVPSKYSQKLPSRSGRAVSLGLITKALLPTHYNQYAKPICYNEHTIINMP